jgi:CubicO group peptidase (beta-lactamase class C family)
MYRLISLLLVCSFTALAADDLPLATPVSVGMSAERLGRIGDWLDGVIERKEAAGFVTLVARRGKVVHHEARGNRGMSVKEPMPSDALFDLVSMTKSITVAAVLMLLEEGRFTLTDPISKYLPAFKDRGMRMGEHAIVPAESEITVQQLFTHTSGVGATWTRAEKFEYTTRKEYIQALAGLPLNYQLGSTWLYDDSHDVLGYLVETVAQQPLGEFVQQRVLDPLGMADTHYWPPSSKDDRRAVLVVRGEDDLDSTARRPLKAAERAVLDSGGLLAFLPDDAQRWQVQRHAPLGATHRGLDCAGPSS